MKRIQMSEELRLETLWLCSRPCSLPLLPNFQFFGGDEGGGGSRWRREQVVEGAGGGGVRIRYSSFFCSLANGVTDADLSSIGSEWASMLEIPPEEAPLVDQAVNERLMWQVGTKEPIPVDTEETGNAGLFPGMLRKSGNERKPSVEKEDKKASANQKDKQRTVAGAAVERKSSAVLPPNGASQTGGSRNPEPLPAGASSGVLPPNRASQTGGSRNPEPLPAEASSNVSLVSPASISSPALTRSTPPATSPAPTSSSSPSPLSPAFVLSVSSPPVSNGPKGGAPSLRRPVLKSSIRKSSLLTKELKKELGALTRLLAIKKNELARLPPQVLLQINGPESITRELVLPGRPQIQVNFHLELNKGHTMTVLPDKFVASKSSLTLKAINEYKQSEPLFFFFSFFLLSSQYAWYFPATRVFTVQNNFRGTWIPRKFETFRGDRNVRVAGFGRGSSGKRYEACNLLP